MNQNALQATMLSHKNQTLGPNPFVISAFEPKVRSLKSNQPSLEAQISGMFTNVTTTFAVDYMSEHTLVWATDCE